ncbi:MAG: SPOR domain-containing protein [Burkholderiales bacterium]
MRYSRMTTPPPRKKRKYANVILVLIILGIAAYLISAGAAGKWIAENIIDPVFNSGGTNAAPPAGSSDGISPLPSLPGDTISPVTLPAASGARAQQNLTASELSIFALQTGAFSDESNAKSAAGDIALRGGAGYIAYDGDLYRVLIAGYLSQSDADNVKTRLEGEGIAAKVYNIKSGSLSFNIEAEQSQIDAIKACFDAVPQAAQSLQQIVYDSDKGQNVDADITALKERINLVTQNLNKAVSSEAAAIKSLQTYMGTFCETINNIPLSSSVSSVEFLSKLKYTLIGVVVDYSAFLDSLSG